MQMELCRLMNEGKLIRSPSNFWIAMKHWNDGLTLRHQQSRRNRAWSIDRVLASYNTRKREFSWLMKNRSHR